MKGQTDLQELYNALIDQFKFTIRLVRDLEKTNTQEYLDFMDKMNELSILD